jgi:hypothetical protein
MAGNLGCQKCLPFQKIAVGEFHDTIAGITLVHSSSMTPPLGLTDAEIF